MSNEETIRSLPNQSRRHCPECGARLADGTQTCSICGTDLTELDASDEAEAGAVVSTPEERFRKLKPLHIAILAVVAIVVLAGSAILGLNLSQGAAAPELPTFTPTIAATPTETATPTASPTATPTPLPTASPTPIPPIDYVVEAGDMLGAIAAEYDITVDELMALNDLDSEMITEGQTLLIPPPTPTPGPTPTPPPDQPTATPAPFEIYTVKPGDTLSDIAVAYGVTVEEILAASDLPPGTEMIQPDTALTIPRYTPTPTPEVIDNATPTPTPGLMSYPAPQMLFPPDSASYTGADVTIALQWASVGILDDREYYEVELMIPTEEGRELRSAYVKSTVWRLPQDLLPAETMENRTFAWRVLVVRQISGGDEPEYRIISQASARRTFTWLAEPSED